MIKANELRIGNWFKSNIYQQVDLQHLEYLLNENFAPHNAMQPILLTPEILESAGFNVKYGEGDRRSLQSRTLAETEGISVIFYNSDKIFFININGFVLKRPFLKYLHQLQNIHFALTGKELEINLNA